MTAEIHNTVRLRVFLILVFSIVIRIVRELSSDSVHKASGILEANYFLYGIILICSLLPLKPAWLVALGAQSIVSLINLSSLLLATIATWRCIDQVGCIQTLPASVVTVVLIGIVSTFDLLQTWSVYLIVTGPMFISSATQRIRILFSWALPFAYLINITLLSESSWTMLVTPHLVIDTIIIIMAQSGENILLGSLMCLVFVADIIAVLSISNSLVTTAIYVQITLTVGSILMLFVTTNQEETEENSDNFESAESVLPEFVKKYNTNGVRLRKSNSTKKSNLNKLSF
tara:strand:+ start:741 stop:1601 length:861 start_codon:yes stop_codon:yes gene_type:complete